jgi:hypothetical protein
LHNIIYGDWKLYHGFFGLYIFPTAHGLGRLGNLSEVDNPSRRIKILKWSSLFDIFTDIEQSITSPQSLVQRLNYLGEIEEAFCDSEKSPRSINILISSTTYLPLFYR